MNLKKGWTYELLVGLMILSITGVLSACAPKARPPKAVLDTPEHHVSNGYKLLKLGKIDDALREFTLAKELDPKSSGANLGLGLAWGYKREYEKGLKEIKLARKYAKTKQEKVDSYLGFMRLYIMGKERLHKEWLARTEDAFGKAHVLLPDAPGPYYYMGIAYKDAYMFDKAIPLFRKVLEINKQYVAEADREYGLIQKIQRAAPGTKIGKKIALIDKITRADMAALFIQELKIDRIFAKNEKFDTGYKAPSRKFVAERLVKTPPALDIQDHVLKADIEAVIRIGINGLQPFPDHTFKPDKIVTRAEYAMMIQDILIKITADEKLATKFIGTPSPFPDLRSDLPYYNAVMVCTTRGIMEANNLTTGEFDPLGPVSGADALLIIRKLRSEIEKSRI
nr:hypothetical protein [Desulfobacterales bacterium]